MEGVLIRARQRAENYLTKLIPESAIFWAEKAVILSDHQVDDVILYSQALYASKQYKRGANFLQNSPLFPHCAPVRYLAAKCLAACKLWDEVVSILTTEENPPLDESSRDPPSPEVAPIASGRLGDVTAVSHLLLGNAYQALGNIQQAIDCYKEALVLDPFCEEALEYLYDLNAMQMNDEEALMSNLSFKQCSVEEELITKYLYQHKLHHSKIFNSSKKPLTLPDQCQPLTKSLDVQSHIASNFLQMMNIKECYKITQNILKQDPYHLPTIIIFIACCVINNSTKDLYRLGQEMVKCFPELALSWYAVSCYYYSLGKHVMTRRYLTKAINLDPHFSHAHFAFGLSFASEGEHDQAIAAFSHAARYLKTSYLPLMYLGKEYSITGNLPIAISFFKNAQILAPNNATLLQEIGIVLANSGHYSKARVYFEKAAAILQKVDPHVTLPMWEPVYNNLGHILRKEGNYAGALDAHYKALQLIPNEPSTLSCIAFVYILMEDYENVIHYCNQSLRLRREDRFTIELLSHAVNELAGAEVDLTLKPSMNSSDLDKMIYEN